MYKAGKKIIKLRKVYLGATMVEFVTAVPAILFLGLGSVQAGLIYHGKSTLNYATFEAARAGAVNHAQLSSMKNELGFRLAPLFGGDGTPEKAAQAIASSMANVSLLQQTSIEILNPTVQAFDDWGQISRISGARAIPNSHLRLRHVERKKIGTHSGLNLHDANLLKIKVTHGFKMRIPVVGGVIAKSLMLLDPGNARFYALNQLPITSVATVRMQSEAWESQALVTAVAPVAAGGSTPGQFVQGSQTTGVSAPCVDEYGLSGHTALMSSADFGAGNGVCGYDSAGDVKPLVSPSSVSGDCT